MLLLVHKQLINNAYMKNNMLNKNELREIDIRYEIEELKKERNLTDFEDEIEVIDEKIDKLEIELLTMTDEEDTDKTTEYSRQKDEEAQILQRKADMAREEYNEMIEQEADELNSKEYQQQAQERLDTMNDLDNSQR